MTEPAAHRRIIDRAAELYLAGDPLDMSALALGLGISRATLYRQAGNREDVLATVLAEATERTCRRAIAEARGSGAELVVDVLRRFMESVDRSRALRALTIREPSLFVRLAMMPGAIEATSSRIIGELLGAERDAGRLALPLDADVLAEAMVRICDVHLYAPLLGGTRPEIDTALAIVDLLLRAPAHDEALGRC